MINPPIHFTQGDDAVLKMKAVDGNMNPVNLTDASFTTFINGPNGVVQSFPNVQHFADPDQIANTGNFTLTLSQSDTASCGLGDHKEIITLIDIGGAKVMFRGFNSLQVYPPVPLE